MRSRTTNSPVPPGLPASTAICAPGGNTAGAGPQLNSCSREAEAVAVLALFGVLAVGAWAQATVAAHNRMALPAMVRKIVGFIEGCASLIVGCIVASPVSVVGQVRSAAPNGACGREDRRAGGARPRGDHGDFRFVYGAPGLAHPRRRGDVPAGGGSSASPCSVAHTATCAR